MSCHWFRSIRKVKKWGQTNFWRNIWHRCTESWQNVMYRGKIFSYSINSQNKVNICMCILCSWFQNNQSDQCFSCRVTVSQYIIQLKSNLRTKQKMPNYKCIHMTLNLLWIYSTSIVWILFFWNLTGYDASCRQTQFSCSIPYYDRNQHCLAVTIAKWFKLATVALQSTEYGNIISLCY